MGKIKAEAWLDFIYHNGPMPMLEPSDGYRVVRTFVESLTQARKDADKSHAALRSLASNAPVELGDEFNQLKKDAMLEARILERTLHKAFAPELGIHEVKVPTDGNT